MAIKIKNWDFRENISFRDLDYGSVFVLSKGDSDDGCEYRRCRYMKVWNGRANCEYNAISLDNGLFSLKIIDENTKVEEIRAELLLDENVY